LKLKIEKEIKYLYFLQVFYVFLKGLMFLKCLKIELLQNSFHILLLKGLITWNDNYLSDLIILLKTDYYCLFIKIRFFKFKLRQKLIIYNMYTIIAIINNNNKFIKLNILKFLSGQCMTQVFSLARPLIEFNASQIMQRSNNVFFFKALMPPSKMVKARKVVLSYKVH